MTTIPAHGLGYHCGLGEVIGPGGIVIYPSACTWTLNRSNPTISFSPVR